MVNSKPYILPYNESFSALIFIALFASRVNKKVSRYSAFYVALDSVENDVFSFSWQCEFFCAFPPSSIIHTVLRKTENEQAEVIIIAPLFTIQPWFTRLFKY